MITIKVEGVLRILHGENVTREESWNGIGSDWGGYSALLTDCVGGLRLVLTTNKNLETHEVIDCSLVEALEEDEREAVCLHYGLMCRGKKHDLSSTTTLLNKIYGRFHDRHYHEGEVNNLINSAIHKLAVDPDIREYINQRTGGECFPLEEVVQ